MLSGCWWGPGVDPGIMPRGGLGMTLGSCWWSPGGVPWLTLALCRRGLGITPGHAGGVPRGSWGSPWCHTGWVLAWPWCHARGFLGFPGFDPLVWCPWGLHMTPELYWWSPAVDPFIMSGGLGMTPSSCHQGHWGVLGLTWCHAGGVLAWPWGHVSRVQGWLKLLDFPVEGTWEISLRFSCCYKLRKTKTSVKLMLKNICGNVYNSLLVVMWQNRLKRMAPLFLIFNFQNLKEISYRRTDFLLRLLSLYVYIQWLGSFRKDKNIVFQLLKVHLVLDNT